MNRKKVLTKKKVTGVATLIVALAIIITGTFAWKDFSQFAVSLFKADASTKHWVSLVDDFKDATNAEKTELTGWKRGDVSNKEIYVTSDPTDSKANKAGYDSQYDDEYQPVYVRVKLEQELTIGGGDPIVDTNAGNGADSPANQYPSYVQWTQTDSEITSIADWVDDGSPLDEEYWILDDTDEEGWLYWSKPLAFGDTTDHLINKVELLIEPDKALEYTVEVTLEAVSADLNSKTGSDEYEGGFANWKIAANAAIMPLFGASSYTLESEDMLMTTIGSTQQLTLSRTPDNGVATTATWTSSDTAVATVNATGVVTAAGDGTATITAETVDNQTVTKDVIVATAGTTFSDPDTTTLWRVLVADDGSGNALIITECVYNRNASTPIQYNTSNTWSLYESSNLKTLAILGMDAWYGNDANVGTTLKGKALDYAYQDASGNSVVKGTTGAGIEYDFDGSDYAWDTYVNATAQRAITKAGGSENASVFALSISEVNYYSTVAGGTTLNKIASGDDGAGAIAARNWWLRSPGGSSSNPASCVTTDGNRGYSTATYPSLGFRPALWINR